MKIWVDDIRPAPDDDWAVCLNSKDAIFLLECVKARPSMYGKISLMSLDHDLGGDDTSRRIVLWMCENDFWPVKTVVHSANPVGIEWLEGMIKRYGP